jgi:AcrR family transcriptional regulator
MLAVRFEHAMRAKLALVAPYRDMLGALFSTTVNPRSTIAVLGDHTADIRQQVGAVFAAVVTGATDPPRQPQAGQLALVLYGVHLAVLFFWLHDRSPKAQATEELLALIRDGLALIRPLLGLPPVAKILTRLTRVLEPMVGSKT